MYKILLFLLIIPLTVSAADNKGTYTKNKVISKEYKVNSNATLKISNKYGNIDIVSGNSNMIEIKVTITTSGNNEEKVQQRLDQINVEFNGSANEVSAKTIINKNSNSWNVWGKKNNVNMEINYLIKMPVTNNVSLSNDYGGISLDKIEGSATINCDYGKINIGELLNSSNKINIDYTNKSTIDYMKNGAINADYSTLHVEKSGQVDLNADYSHISFGVLEDLDYNCDYGDLKIESCKNLAGNSDYMHTTVGKLSGSGIFDIDYGSLKINELVENFKNITVNSSYTQMKFGLPQAGSFNLNATLSYGNLGGKDNFNLSKEIVKTSSKYYEGYYKSPNSNSSITIKSSYGNISFIN